MDVVFECAYNNTMTNNNVSHNQLGIHLCHSNSIIYLNNFINNTDNVYSYNSTNIWNSTEKITYTYNGSVFEGYLGNYWDDYKERYPDAEEIDECGIWDTPYSIDSDADNHPLVKPWENYFELPENIFDTGVPENPYPSISGTHNGKSRQTKQLLPQSFTLTHAEAQAVIPNMLASGTKHGTPPQLGTATQATGITSPSTRPFFFYPTKLTTTPSAQAPIHRFTILMHCQQRMAG